MARQWLCHYDPRPEARLRLICFPHASGNATFFRSWASRLPATVELVAVQYPGRLDRIAEPCVEDMPTMVVAITEALGPLLADRTVLFGHSMGAAIAYEVTRRVERLFGGPLARLIVSGRPPPRHHVPDFKHQASDEVLWNELRRLGGTTADVLEHPELCAALLPSLRGDYRLIETYRPTIGPPLSSPILALTGDDDPEVTVDQMEVWREYTEAEFDLRVFPGDHFYLTPQRDHVIAEISRVIGGVRRRVS